MKPIRNQRISIPLGMVLLLLPGMARSESASKPASGDGKEATVTAQVHHMKGLDGIAKGAKGQLEVRSTGLNFCVQEHCMQIPAENLHQVAVSNERVELWGVKGKVLRSVIPDGGGMLAAAVLHKRVDLLSVGYHQPQGDRHFALFQMDAESAERVQKALQPMVVKAPAEDAAACSASQMDAASLRILGSAAEDAAPATYSGLMYEEIFDAFKKQKSIQRVYRLGEAAATGSCPRYTLSFRTEDFHAGNQILRDSLGPIGMLAAATKLNQEMTIRDMSDGKVSTIEVKSAVRGDAPSLTIASAEAKKMAKAFVKFRKHAMHVAG